MRRSNYATKAFAGTSLTVLFLTSSVQMAQAAYIFDAPVSITEETVEDDTSFAGYVVPERKKVEMKVIKTMKMGVSAYTSSPDECDASPFITADGTVVRDGIVATNVLPIGTKIRIPAYFGDRIFEVHDRMNERYSYRVDIWMDNKKAAKTWGLKRNVAIEVVEMGNNKRNWEQWKGRSKDLARIGKHGPDVIREET